uniref:ATPase subunit 8 n=1 Tax=Dictyotopsis propagulifera TaxID=670095 RepID=UPI002E77838E|nr:ATPase subunit 8 [Dictyotopsis propagulifera]WBP69961.1 ATPase subunit 8 [Dictyotopsis propagulifera]
MPQFDISSFFNQVFWLFLFFFLLYFLIISFLLPDIVSVIKSRYKKEKVEFNLFFFKVFVFNQTKISIYTNQKLSLLKSDFKFHSAL